MSLRHGGKLVLSCVHKLRLYRCCNALGSCIDCLGEGSQSDSFSVFDLSLRIVHASEQS